MQQHFEITLAADETRTVRARGTIFVVKTATAEFEVRPNNRSIQPMNQGGRFGDPQSRPFGYLTFHNTSGGSNTITYIVSTEPVEIAQTVTTNVTQTGAAISNSLDSCIAATPLQFLQTSTAAAAPLKLTASQTYFRKAIIFGVKTLAGALNTGSVFIGPSATASQQPIEIQSGGEYVLEPPNGVKWNFADWYFDVGTNGDGVVVIYT